MDIEPLTAFFRWCTIFNGGLLLLWTAIAILAPNFLYRSQTRWFALSRETFDLAMYCFIGLFKIFFLVFNLVPWLALVVVGS
jgi:hypothetical protein